MMENKFGLPFLGFGMGLRTVHFQHILDNKPKMDWFEIISENFMDTDGRPIRVLDEIRKDYPIVMHGVSLSIGSADPLNKEYLKKLKKLADWVNPVWVSDHLCWTGINNIDSHDLLPVPYTQKMLDHISDRIKQVQDYMGRPLILENPSTYLEFKDSEVSEWDFLRELVEGSDCGLLLDVNNVYVSCFNHKWDEKNYIDSIPAERVVQIHLAGHENNGTHIIDTHEGPIIDPVWALYQYTVSKIGNVSTMVEWDTDTPDFEIVAAEVKKARELANKSDLLNDLPSHFMQSDNDNEILKREIEEVYEPIHSAIIKGDSEVADPESWIPKKENFTPSEQLDVYVSGYRKRLHEVLSGDLEVTRFYLGDKKTDKLIFDYIEETPSHNFNLAHYIKKLPEFAFKKDYLDEFAKELVRLETAITTIFDWEETPALTNDAFVNMEPEKLLETKLQPRKALGLYAFEYPVSEYYRAVKFEEVPEKPEKHESFVAVYRHDEQMLRLSLDKSEYKMLKLIFDDNKVGEAIEKLISNNEINQEELGGHFQDWFSRWISSGLLAA